MARPLRIQYENALYHVMSRGNERKNIVRDDLDRKKRLEWLEKTVEIYGWDLFSFVLMDNHDHLFLQTPQANLSEGMQYLNGCYTSYFNRRHRRHGHLFQGRFRAQLIEEQGHYLELSRYIHLNPVRANMVDRPEQWRWSSYPGYHRSSKILSWVDYDTVLGEFGSTKQKAKKQYRVFVRQGMDKRLQSPVSGAVSGLIVGSDTFVSKIKDMLVDHDEDLNVPDLSNLKDKPSLTKIIHTVGAVFGESTKSWQNGRRVDNASRAMAAYIARKEYGYSALAVSKGLGYRSHSGVAEAIRRVERSKRHLLKQELKIKRQLANDK